MVTAVLLISVLIVSLVAIFQRNRVRFGKIKARIHRIKKDGTYEQMFKSISNDLDKLCFAKKQIETFLKNRSDWFLKKKDLILFLFKENEQFHVARVHLVLGGSLEIVSHSFENECIWHAKKKRRCIVVPA